MSDQITPVDPVQGDVLNAAVPSQPPKFISQWVTTLAVILCTVIFVGVTSKNQALEWDTLAGFGYLPASDIWNGAVWALVTSAFVHVEAWHFVFNIYWLWVLGTRMEGAIGAWRYFLFYILAAFVTSAIQMAASDTTGIGASGVLYAMFGFMWVGRRRYRVFCEAVNSKTILWFVVWMFGCFVVTQLKVMNIGNAAHLSGLAFGASVAGAFVLRDRRRLSLAGLTGLVVLSVVPLLWCPGSVTWLSVQAHNAHVAGRLEEALKWYSKIIRLQPRNAWAYMNRGSANASLGRMQTAKSDYNTAMEIDPSVFGELPEK